MGYYRIEYSCGVIQYKNLISDEDYRTVVKPLRGAIEHLSVQKKSGESTGVLKGVINNLYGEEFFTESSPLGMAIKTGILNLPEAQGGKTKIKIKRV